MRLRYIDKLVNPVDCHMSAPRLSNSSRKRQRSEQNPSQVSGLSQSKKQKHDHPTGSPPQEFWDNLSKLWLTKGAVRELNRRNAQPTPYPSYLRCRKPNRPLTRQLLATLKNNRRLVQNAAGFLRDCVPNYSKDIKQFARHGGPDLSDLRGFPEPINPLDRTVNSGRSRSRRRKRSATLTPSSKTQGTQDTEVTKTTSTTAYKRNFEQNLIDHGVYPPEYDYPDGRFPSIPDNWEIINERLARPRASLSPSRKADAHVSKEQPVTVSVIPIIEGKISVAKCVGGGYAFGNLAPLTDGTLAAGKPDHFYGARPEQLDRNIRSKL
ncbi:hypothetical protein ACJ73_07280, partial [Blastomyces percursus]